MKQISYAILLICFISNTSAQAVSPKPRAPLQRFAVFIDAPSCDHARKLDREAVFELEAMLMDSAYDQYQHRILLILSCIDLPEATRVTANYLSSLKNELTDEQVRGAYQALVQLGYMAGKQSNHLLIDELILVSQREKSTLLQSNLSNNNYNKRATGGVYAYFREAAISGLGFTADDKALDHLKSAYPSAPEGLTDNYKAAINNIESTKRGILKRRSSHVKYRVRKE